MQNHNIPYGNSSFGNIDFGTEFDNTLVIMLKKVKSPCKIEFFVGSYS